MIYYNEYNGGEMQIKKNTLVMADLFSEVLLETLINAKKGKMKK